MAVAASLAASSEASPFLRPGIYDCRLSKFPSSLTLRPLPQRRPPRHVFLHHTHSASNTVFVVSSSSSTSAGPNSFDDLASRLVDAARSFSLRTSLVVQSAWLQTVRFIHSQDFQAKIQSGFSFANQKLEAFGYDAYKGAVNLNRRFRFTERAREMADFAVQKMKNVDQELRLAQRFKNASSDFRRNWPMYRRQLNQFLQTPVGRMLMTLLFLWFLLSGWLFRIVLFSLWVLPLAAPLLINSAARSMIVEGACPSCKRRFIGNRTQMILCNYCKAVVWQPRQDYSKDKSDPSIIDVDIE